MFYFSQFRRNQQEKPLQDILEQREENHLLSVVGYLSDSSNREKEKTPMAFRQHIYLVLASLIHFQLKALCRCQIFLNLLFNPSFLMAITL